MLFSQLGLVLTLCWHKTQELYLILLYKSPICHRHKEDFPSSNWSLCLEFFLHFNKGTTIQHKIENSSFLSNLEYRHSVSMVVSPHGIGKSLSWSTASFSIEIVYYYSFQCTAEKREVIRSLLLNMIFTLNFSSEKITSTISSQIRNIKKSSICPSIAALPFFQHMSYQPYIWPKELILLSLSFLKKFFLIN